MKTLTAIICLALLKSSSRIEAFLIDGHHNHNQQAPRSLTPKRCGGGYETKKNPTLFASIPSNEDGDLENNDDEGENDTKTDRIIRYLGRGTNSIVRPGVVLVAPEHEYDHYLRRSVVFVYGIGSNEYGEHVTRGVIIDQPTAFTMVCTCCYYECRGRFTRLPFLPIMFVSVNLWYICINICVLHDVRKVVALVSFHSVS